MMTIPFSCPVMILLPEAAIVSDSKRGMKLSCELHSKVPFSLCQKLIKVDSQFRQVTMWNLLNCIPSIYEHMRSCGISSFGNKESQVWKFRSCVSILVNL